MRFNKVHDPSEGIEFEWRMYIESLTDDVAALVDLGLDFKKFKFRRDEHGAYILLGKKKLKEG